MGEEVSGQILLRPVLMAMIAPTPPLFFWCPDDLTSFDGIAEAERYLEPPDVRSGAVGCGFDSLGLRLIASVVVMERRSVLGSFKVEAVRVITDTCSSARPDELKGILLKYLSYFPEFGPDVLKLSLEELIRIAHARAKVR